MSKAIPVRADQLHDARIVIRSSTAAAANCAECVISPCPLKRYSAPQKPKRSLNFCKAKDSAIAVGSQNHSTPRSAFGERSPFYRSSRRQEAHFGRTLIRASPRRRLPLMESLNVNYVTHCEHELERGVHLNFIHIVGCTLHISGTHPYPSQEGTEQSRVYRCPVQSTSASARSDPSREG
jgi:hypothetical protein